jgi:two-component system cell cycle response regulator DivK
LKNILIAEDNMVNQMVLEEMVTILQPNSTISIANDGVEALALLKEQSFDLVLSDIQMPNMDGYALFTAIKEELKLDIPVIAVTAFAVAGDKEKLLMHGFNDYISKPIVLDNLRQVLDKYNAD